MIDYHVHTRLCNHAEGTMAEFVERAAAIGLKEICFLDHLTLQEQGRKLSMAPDEVPFYFQAVQRLKKQYEGRIRVKAGLEVDFHEGLVEKAMAVADTFALDVIGSSVHFPSGENIVSRRAGWGNGDVYTDAQADAVFCSYYETLDRMLDYDYFDIICHFDLAKKFGRKAPKTFDKEISRILTRIREKDLTVELNTSGYDHAAAEIYPAPDIVQRCKEFGISFALGSDAHEPGSVGRYFDRALKVLQKAGYGELATFDRRHKTMIPIEITMG